MNDIAKDEIIDCMIDSILFLFRFLIPKQNDKNSVKAINEHIEILVNIRREMMKMNEKGEDIA